MNQVQIKKEFEAIFQERIEKSISQLSIDCVIFSFHEERLKVLLLKIFSHDAFILPSGFIFQEEDIDTAALRNLKERTGLEQIFLQQFHAFGKASRYYPDQIQEFIASMGIDENKLKWLFQRFVSIGYYALVNFHKTKPQVDVFTEKYEWADVQQLPTMILDHADMVQKAMEALKKDLQTQPIGLQLLPDEFTLPELHQLYEIILDRKIDRRNFRKKMLQSSIITPLNQQKSAKGHRAPNLYQFNQEQYELSLQEEVKMGF